MSTLYWLRCALIVAAVVVTAQPATAQEKDKEKEKAPGAVPLPPVGVEAPRVPIDVPVQPSEPVIPQGIRDFTFRGSPFFDSFNRQGTLFGPPITSFDNPRFDNQLGPAQIQESQSSTVPQLLENVPGVLIQRTNAGGGSFVIRGRNGQQNLLMIDGIPVNDSGWRAGNVQYLNYIDPGMIERIEVIRGPASVLYGSGATGGVLNIVTKSRQDFSRNIGFNGELITNYSTALHDPYNWVSVQGNFQNFGYLLGGSTFNQGSIDAGGHHSFPELATGYDQIAGNVRLDWHATPYLTVTFNYMHLFQNDVPRTDRFPLREVDPVRFTNRPTFADQTHDLGYLRLAWANPDAVGINGMQATGWLQRRDERERETDLRVLAAPVFFNRSEEVNYGGLDLRAFTNIGPANTLLYGFTYIMDTVDSDQFRIRVRPTRIDKRTPTLPPDGMYQQLGVFLMDYATITDWWSVTAGVRYSQIHAKGTARFGGTAAGAVAPPLPFDRHFPDWSAEVGTVVRVTDQLHWVANVAEGFRAPNLEDLGANERQSGLGSDNGNTTLDTERVINYETGLKYASNWLQASATYYYMNFPSQITRSVLPSAALTRVNTDAFLYGTEAEFALFLPRNFTVFGSFSYSFGSDTSLVLPRFGPPVNFPGQVGSPLRTVPPYGVIGGRWTYSTPRCGFFVETWGDMMGDFDRVTFIDRGDPRVPLDGEKAWQTFNLRAGIDGNRLGQLTLGLYNIFDQHYRILGSGVDAPGFEFRVGYRLAF